VKPPRDEELHDRLMDAFRRYFKANQEWVEKGTRRAGLKTRKLLSEIRHIAIERREVIMQWRYEIDREKAERKALQKAKKKKVDDNI
jgi:hypothetical protein